MIFILPNHPIGDFWFWTFEVDSRRCDTESIDELQMWVPLQQVKNRSFLFVRFPKLKQLPARQKLKLAEELWFDGVSDGALPVPAWHQELLTERVAAYKAGNLKTISIGELKRRLKLR